MSTVLVCTFFSGAQSHLVSLQSFYIKILVHWLRERERERDRERDRQRETDRQTETEKVIFEQKNYSFTLRIDFQACI